MAVFDKFNRRVRFQRALKDVYETESGKLFFEVFLEHCGVTRPKFTRDPAELTWNESRRHLAMSYLKLLAQDDMEAMLRRSEESLRNMEEEINE